MEARTGIVFALVPTIIVNCLAEAAAQSVGGVIEVADFSGMDGWFHPNLTLLSCGGLGEAIVVWGEGNDSISRIRAAKVNRFGELMWNSKAIELCGDMRKRSAIRALSDKKGGIMAAWIESCFDRWNLKIVKLDRYGLGAWPHGVATICSTLVDCEDFQIAPDGRGGAYVTWRMRTGKSSSIFIRRVTCEGKLVPEKGAVQVTVPGRCVFNPQVARFGSRGAVITWMQWSGDGWDIFGQRVDSSCMIMWSLEGVPICTAGGDQGRQMMAEDACGGAVVAWMDRRDGTWDIYAQRIDDKGGCLWGKNGKQVTHSGFRSGYPEIESDSKGGAYISWLSDLGVSRGSRESMKGGMEIVIPIPYYRRRIIGGSLGPEIRAAEEPIERFLSESCMDGEDSLIAFVNKVDCSGNLEWGDDGVRLGTANETDWYVDIANDRSGRAVVCWSSRRGDETSIAAAMVGKDGSFIFKRTDLAAGIPAGYKSHSRIETGDNGEFFLSWLNWLDGGIHVFFSRMNDVGEAGFTERVRYRVNSSEEGISLRWEAKEPSKAKSFIVGRADGLVDSFKVLGIAAEETFPGSYSITDTTVSPGGKYTYCVTLVTDEGAVDLFQTDTIRVPIGTTNLYPCYPNPFNSVLRIPYFISRDSIVLIEVFDLLGRRIKVIAKRRSRAGRHVLCWDGSNDEGRKISSGVYFVRLKTRQSEYHRKVVLIR